MAAQGQGAVPGGRGPPPGPPYPPQYNGLGGQPDILPDIPICAVFLVLFLLGAIANIAIFNLNRKQAHKFLLSNAMVAFCVIRVVTMSLRIAWATNKRNVSLAIAAQIFVFAGTIILFIVNLVFTQRVIRAQHSTWGWHRAFKIGFRILVAIIVATVLMLIIVTVLSFYRQDAVVRRVARDCQLYGSTYYAFVSFLPIPLVAVSIILPKRVRVEKFGSGRFRTKIGVLLTTSLLLTIGAAWRCATNWADPVPAIQPSPWYFSKAYFFAFNFGIEAIVIGLYIFVRVDWRFHIPNGANGPGSYQKVWTRESNLAMLEKGENMRENEQMLEQSGLGGTLRMYSEEELFDDTCTLAETLNYNATSLSLDRRSGKWVLKRESMQSLYSPFNSNIEPSEYGYSAYPTAYTSMYNQSRGSDMTGSSAIYSAIEMPRATQLPVQAFNADDMRWETISMAQSHAPKFRAETDTWSVATKSMRNPKGYSRSSIADEQRPRCEQTSQHAQTPRSASRQSTGSMPSLRGGRQSTQTEIPPMPSMPPLPRSNSRGSSSKRASHDVNGPSDVEYSSHDGTTAGVKQAYSVLDGKSDYGNRKSSWRRSVETEMKLRNEEQDIADEKARLAELRESEDEEQTSVEVYAEDRDKTDEDKEPEV